MPVAWPPSSPPCCPPPGTGRSLWRPFWRLPSSPGCTAPFLKTNSINKSKYTKLGVFFPLRQEVSSGRHFPSPSAAKCNPLSLYGAQLQKLGSPFAICTWLILAAPIWRGPTSCRGRPSRSFTGTTPPPTDPLVCRFLTDAFYLYAVDIVGHPGKGAEASFPACDRWASQVVLGWDLHRCAVWAAPSALGHRPN